MVVPARQCGDLLRKRNQKVAIKPPLPGPTGPPPGVGSPPPPPPSWPLFVRHDEPLHGPSASFLCVCVAHESGPPRVIRRLAVYRFCWPAHARHHEPSRLDFDGETPTGL